MPTRADFLAAVERTVGRSVTANGCCDGPLWALREIGLPAPAKPPFQSVASAGAIRVGLESCADRIGEHEREAGDVAVMMWKGEARHVGVYVGEGLIVHARSGCGVVVKEPLRRAHRVVEWWRVRGLE